ncbi:MFS transporter [Paraburkholderia sp.]|uniref:MFS transporter n=1 Tax=Paraburkholderia sp. TaxID=1926495 RepID=UPI002F3E5009
MVANIVGGILTEFFGGRLMLTLALLPLGVLTFSFGFTQSLAFGIVIQATMGFAAGADYSAGMKIIPAWFTRDRGRAMGLYTTATSLAVVLANAIVPSFSSALVARCGDLTALLAQEAADSKSAPKTHALMREILDTSVS